MSNRMVSFVTSLFVTNNNGQQQQQQQQQQAQHHTLEYHLQEMKNLFTALRAENATLRDANQLLLARIQNLEQRCFFFI